MSQFFWDILVILSYSMQLKIRILKVQFNFMQKKKKVLLNPLHQNIFLNITIEEGNIFNNSICYSICNKSWVSTELRIMHKWCISLISTSRTISLCCWFMSQCVIHWNKGPHKVYGYHEVVNQLCSFRSHSKHLCHIVDSSTTCSCQGGLAHRLWSILDLLQSCHVLVIKKKNLLSSFSYRYPLNSQQYL